MNKNIFYLIFFNQSFLFILFLLFLFYNIKLYFYFFIYFFIYYIQFFINKIITINFNNKNLKILIIKIY